MTQSLPLHIRPERTNTSSSSSATPLGLLILDVPILQADGTHTPRLDSWKDIVCHWTKGELQLNLHTPLKDWLHHYYNGKCWRLNTKHYQHKVVATKFLDEFQGNKDAFLRAYGSAAHLGHMRLLNAIIAAHKRHRGDGEHRHHLANEWAGGPSASPLAFDRDPDIQRRTTTTTVASYGNYEITKWVGPSRRTCQHGQLAEGRDSMTSPGACASLCDRSGQVPTPAGSGRSASPPLRISRAKQKISMLSQSTSWTFCTSELNGDFRCERHVAFTTKPIPPLPPKFATPSGSVLIGRYDFTTQQPPERSVVAASSFVESPRAHHILDWRNYRVRVFRLHPLYPLSVVEYDSSLLSPSPFSPRSPAFSDGEVDTHKLHYQRRASSPPHSESITSSARMQNRTDALACLEGYNCYSPWGGKMRLAPTICVEGMGSMADVKEKGAEEEQSTPKSSCLFVSDKVWPGLDNNQRT
ncbi:hypothetical protein M404DRAFT_33239 [Pisolithus tinctorius Marx 270]|uniref:Uncharacterized protein n=1 Tax=Pisolithus tinctorius Marx 270 TaxID=870435 RepID=A0A0C3JFQ0_PISTI|nr:hypothetical protein M404DRAFT_33239 [Pisolithus tinctorius Marx 270]